MSIKETVKLMLKSSDNNPYSGKLTDIENVISAINLAKLCKHFTDNGEIDEAMNLDNKHWNKVIVELYYILENII